MPSSKRTKIEEGKKEIAYRGVPVRRKGKEGRRECLVEMLIKKKKELRPASMQENGNLMSTGGREKKKRREGRKQLERSPQRGERNGIVQP